MENEGQVANPPEEGPRRAYIVVVEDKEINCREYVTLARSDKEAAKNIENGLYITESEPTVIEHLEAVITRVDRLDEALAKKIDEAQFEADHNTHQELLDEANRLIDSEDESEEVAP